MKNKSLSSQLSAELRNVLLKEYEDKKAKNRRYSVRAFAKRIGAEHSYLVRVLSGDRNISYSKFLEFAYKGQISQNVFRSIIEKYHKLMPEESFILPWTLEEYKFLFETDSVAITSIIGALNPKYDVKLLSKLVGSSESHVESIIKKGISMGLIKIDDDERLTSMVANYGNPTVVDSEYVAIRQRTMQRSLEHALEYLKKVFSGKFDVDKSFHTSMNFVTTKNAINPKLKAKIMDEQRKMFENVFNGSNSKKKNTNQAKAGYSWNLHIVPTWEE